MICGQQKSGRLLALLDIVFADKEVTQKTQGVAQRMLWLMSSIHWFVATLWGSTVDFSLGLFLLVGRPRCLDLSRTRQLLPGLLVPSGAAGGADLGMRVSAPWSSDLGFLQLFSSPLNG